MEYAYDIYCHEWYNIEVGAYAAPEFDSSKRKHMLKLKKRYPILDRMGSKYSYRDLDDIKVVFKDGMVFGYCHGNGFRSWVCIPKKYIVNPSILKKHPQDLRFLGDYIRNTWEYCDNDEEKRKQDELTLRKLTDEQKLYIELNKSLLGLEDFSTIEGGDDIA